MVDSAPHRAGATSATLKLPHTPISQVYAVTILDSLRIGNCITENSALFHFRKSLLRVTPERFVFEINTLDFFQSQGQNFGPLEEEMIRLKERLVLETDHSGRVVRVANKDELREKWEALKPGLKASYRDSATMSPAQIDQIGLVLSDDGNLESVLAQSPEYSALFPPIYNLTYSAKSSHTRSLAIPRFVGDLALPLLLEARLEERPTADGPHKLLVEGTVDYAHYPAEEVQQTLRKLTDKFDLDTRLLSIHQESYSFGELPSQELLEATRHTLYEVPGVFGKELVVLAQLLAD